MNLPTRRSVRTRTRICRRLLSKRGPVPSDRSGLTLAAVDVTPLAVTIASPASGTASDDPKPLISGLTGGAAGDSALVTIRVYAGSTASGPALQSISTARLTGNWYITEPVPLQLGTYTLRAEQTDTAGNTGYSSPVIYTVTGVDTVAPVVSLASPPASSTDTTPTLAGIAGQLVGDSTSVTLRLYAGGNVSGALVQTLTASRGGGGAYATDATALTPSTYTARAEQTDSAGNTGYSTPVTFAITGTDTVAPTVALNAPPASSTDATPTLAGTAGIAIGDSTSITVRIHSGAESRNHGMTWNTSIRIIVQNARKADSRPFSVSDDQKTPIAM